MRPPTSLQLWITLIVLLLFLSMPYLLMTLSRATLNNVANTYSTVHKDQRQLQPSSPSPSPPFADPMEELVVCYLVNGEYVQETMFAMVWWILVNVGTSGAQGPCDVVCPCKLNSRCSGLSNTSFQCTCNPGFQATQEEEDNDDDGKSSSTNNPNCEATTTTIQFRQCLVSTECGAGLTCMDGVCLSVCDSEILACPEDWLECVDDPQDECNPLVVNVNGSCPGICVGRGNPLPSRFCDMNGDGDNLCREADSRTCVRKGVPCSGSVNETCIGVCEPRCETSNDCLEDGKACFRHTCDNNFDINCPGFCDDFPRECGGVFHVPCPIGYNCASNPDNPCDFKTADPGCFGICAMSCNSSSVGSGSCPSGTTCVDDPYDECHPISDESCAGSCFPIGPCDDPLGITCPYGTVCAFDQACDPLTTNCTKICVEDDRLLYSCSNVTGVYQGCPLDKFCSILDCGPDGCYGTCRDPPVCDLFLQDDKCPIGYGCMDDPFQSCRISINETECRGRCTKLCGGNFSDAQCADGSVCTEPTFKCPFGVDCLPFCESVTPCGVASKSSSCIGNAACVVEPCPCDDSTPCFQGYRCSADPDSFCFFDGSPGCSGVCVPECGGPTNKSCPNENLFCHDDFFDDCDPVNGGVSCFGVCHAVISEPIVKCAGPVSLPCPVAYTCIISDDCTDSDCFGSCQRACAGFADFKCPSDKYCQDDPRDDCNPFGGGFLCPGICVSSQLDLLLGTSSSSIHLSYYTLLTCLAGFFIY